MFNRLLMLLIVVLLSSCEQHKTPLAPGPLPSVVAAQSNTGFGLNFYKALAEKEDNIFISPVSIAASFAMIQPGAKGETAKQLSSVMLPEGATALGAFLRQLPLEQPGRTLCIANGFWLQHDYSVKPPFRAAIETNFGASSQPIDFRLREAAAKLINDWVATKTNNRIRTLVDATALDPDSRMALVNTAWFKADWESPFRQGDTFPEDFFAADGKPRKIPFMHKQEPMRMIAEEDFQAIELPYVGNEMSMILFLPNARDGLASFEKGLTAEKLGGWIQKLRQTTPRYVKLSLPRIALEARYDLAPPLSAMGMALPFTSRADFSGITAEEDLMIGMAVHQTFLLIDEKGTEAAAATALVPVPVSMPPPSLPFRADHPYFLLIHDNRSGAPVFIGRIRTPRTSY